MYDDDLARPMPVRRSFYATLVPFPLACFILAFLTDLTYLATDSVLWETFSVWLLALGLVVAFFAVVGGLCDLVRRRTVRLPARPWLRVLGEFVAFGLALLNVFIHSRDGYTAVFPEGLILSAATVLVLLATLFAGRRVRAVRPTRGFA